MVPADRAARLEILFVYSATVATAGAIASGLFGAVVTRHSGELIGLLFLAVGLHFGGKLGLRRAGLSLGGLMLPPEGDADSSSPDEARRDFLGLRDLASALLRAAPEGLREAAFAFAVAIAIFPPFVLGFYLYHQPTHPFDPAGLASLGGPLAWAELALAQLLVVALPEEAFFRGYIQTRLAAPADARDASLRAPLVLVVQSALFAIVHLVSDASVACLAVFFPGLLFGFIRARRGGIGAALVFHALCNLLSEALTRAWL